MQRAEESAQSELIGRPEPAGASSCWDRFFADPERAAIEARASLATPDLAGQAWALLTLAAHAQRFGNAEGGGACLAAARARFGAEENERGLWLCDALGATQRLIEGEPAAALAQAERLVDRPPPAGCELDLHHAYSALSFCHKRMGNFEGGLRWLYANLALVREHRAQPQTAIVLLNLSAYLMSIDEWPEALACLREAAGIAAGLPNAALARRIDLNLALCLRSLNRRDEALALTQRALRDADLDPGSRYSLFGNAAALYLELGRLDESRAALDQAWILARADGSPLQLADCHCVEGQLEAALGRHRSAIGHFEQAAGHAGRVTEVHVPVLTTILEKLAECHARLGDGDGAYAAHKRFFAAYEARLGYTQRARFFAERARHDVDTMRLERDQARALQRQSEVARHELGALNAKLAARVAEVEALQAQLQDQAIRDALTGLFNRRYWDEILPMRAAAARDAGSTLVIAQIDLDHFKMLNDTHGHAAGDSVLRSFATLISQSLRSGDLICRVGGEEFCILFEHASCAGAVFRLDSLLEQYTELQMMLAGTACSGFTFSAGVACLPRDGVTPDEVMRAADARMYEAKRSGRGRVVGPDQ